MAATSVKKASTNNLMIVFLLITLLVVGVSGIAVKSLVTSIIRDGKVVSAKGKADKQLATNLTAAPKLVEAYTALGSEKNLLADALPTTADLPSLLVVLENMASDTGLTLKTVSPVLGAVAAGTESGTASTATAMPQTYGFSVTFDATYDSLQRFLSDVELSVRPMRVVGVQLNGSGSALSGTIDMQTFYQDKAVLPFSTETIK